MRLLDNIGERGGLLRAAFVASCLHGAFPPVDWRAVCLVCVMALVDEIMSEVKIMKGNG
jgi:hypothetical protein